MVKIHVVKSWVISYTDRPLDLVYSQSIALDRFALPTAVEMNLKLQERVCLLDREDYNPSEDGATCYMCER